jgi:hypothetical protein
VRLREDRAATAIVLRPNGSLGWIARSGGCAGTDRYWVKRRDSRGRATLDQGDGEHAPHDLTRAGRMLRWIRDGIVRTATLR